MSQQAVLTPAWAPLRYHPTQHALWWCPHRFAAVAAGRGSGKTELAKRRLVKSLMVRRGNWTPFRYFYGGPTYKQARRVAWQDLLDLTPPRWIRQVYGSDMRIVTIFESELHVVGLDKPQRIEGVQWDGCVLDESSDLKPGVFDLNVFPALTHRHGWCWRIGVPKRQGIGALEYRDFFERAARGEIPDAAAFTWPSSDIVPAEALAHAQRSMDARDYREQFEASWESAGGQVFHAFDRQQNVRPCQYEPAKVLLVGSDFNVDPMAWVLGHRHGGRLEWFDELWIRNTNTQAALDVLHGRYSGHRGGFEFYGDASGRGRKTSATVTDYQIILNDGRFQQLGRSVFYPKANPNCEDRFAATNAMFCNAAGDRRMHVDPRCKNLIRDLEGRYYKPGTRELGDSGDLGHATDALGYVVHKLFPIRVRLDHTPTVITTKGG